MPIPAEFCTGVYEDDPECLGQFHRWLAAIGKVKDAQINALLRG